jgi:hypothetical protein
MRFKRSKQSSRHTVGPAETKGPLNAAFMLSKPREIGSFEVGCEVSVTNGILPSAKYRTGNTIFAFGKNRSVFCLTAKTG